MILLLAACATSEWAWDLPDHLPEPVVPTDNAMTVERVELGRRLFYDPRLSVDQDMSCASCHDQALAFTDGLAVGQGTTGELHTRGAMSLANAAWSPRLTWANPLLADLEDQALLPLFGEGPIELGMDEVLLVERLESDARYAEWTRAAYDTEPSVATVTQALAAFQRSLVSADAPWDQHLMGRDVLTPSQERGAELFFSERLECFHCHGGPTFSDSVDHAGLPEAEVAFHNTGLYNVDGQGAYPADGTGLHDITGDAADMGRFRAPTLRNIAVTAPYMHDGSIETLDQVLDHYARGGRRIDAGPNAGDGALSPLKSEFVPGFVLTDTERADVLAFLGALTDTGFLTEPAHSDPWCGDAERPEHACD